MTNRDQDLIERPERQKQAFIHDPKNGIQGDCYRTAVACVLGVNRDSVPHSHDDLSGPEAESFIDAWLRPYGLRRIFIPVLGDDFKEVANAMYPRGGGLPLMVTGRGPRNVNHVVVVHGINDFWCPTLGSVDAAVALIGPALPDGYFWAEWIVGDPARLATLQSELNEAREALEPFAKIARLFDHMTDDGGSVLVNVRLGDLRRARAATRTTGGDNGE